MNNTKHCPGFEQFRKLTSFICRCPGCGTEMEIFSDELSRPRLCPQCREQVDFQQCAWHASGGETGTTPER
jgi:hypothetical protein